MTTQSFITFAGPTNPSPLEQATSAAEYGVVVAISDWLEREGISWRDSRLEKMWADLAHEDNQVIAWSPLEYWRPWGTRELSYPGASSNEEGVTLPHPETFNDPDPLVELTLDEALLIQERLGDLSREYPPAPLSVKIDKAVQDLRADTFSWNAVRAFKEIFPYTSARPEYSAARVILRGLENVV